MALRPAPPCARRWSGERRRPAGIVVAVPAAPQCACDMLTEETDAVVLCPATPRSFLAVSEWYVHFLQLTDQEVRDLLERAAH
jgi:predicted phosphoribosyltransferase